MSVLSNSKVYSFCLYLTLSMTTDEHGKGVMSYKGYNQEANTKWPTYHIIDIAICLKVKISYLSLLSR